LKNVDAFFYDKAKKLWNRILGEPDSDDQPMIQLIKDELIRAYLLNKGDDKNG